MAMLAPNPAARWGGRVAVAGCSLGKPGANSLNQQGVCPEPATLHRGRLIVGYGIKREPRRSLTSVQPPNPFLLHD